MLLPNRIDLFNSIGFVWEGRAPKDQTLWTKMFRKLVAYKKLYKDTMVPCRYRDYPKLGLWVSKQRHAYKIDKLLPQRFDLLNSIDFTWNGREAAR
jgi:hypothetical protein